MSTPSLDSIPDGCTCPGVHRAVIEYLLESENQSAGKKILDIPCGSGVLISSLRRFFPNAVLKGCDLKNPASLSGQDFETVDASRPFMVFDGKPFDYVISVSGVMEFDNTLRFFESCREHLRPDGRLIVTNDNISAIRDRLLYLMLGKTSRFPLYPTRDQPTWKAIPISNLIRILEDAGFDILEIRYLISGPKDWLFLPVALLVYPLQLLHRRFNRSGMPCGLRRAMVPFRSLLSRHYMVICKKQL
ncbi:MAG: methyltransferase domain-containing protein [Verrucomicrobiota bacterium]